MSNMSIHDHEQRLVLQPIIHRFAPKSWVPAWRGLAVTWRGLREQFYHDEDVDRLCENVTAQADSIRKMRSMIERIDMARYCVLFEHGGIYADLDMQLVSRESLLDTYSAAMGRGVVVLPLERVGHFPRCLAGQSLMMSPPRHPFWLGLIEFLISKYDPRCYEPHNTGPDAVAMFVNHACKQATRNMMFSPNFISGPITAHHRTGVWRAAAVKRANVSTLPPTDFRAANALRAHHKEVCPWKFDVSLSQKCVEWNYTICK